MRDVARRRGVFKGPVCRIWVHLVVGVETAGPQVVLILWEKRARFSPFSHPKSSVMLLCPCLFVCLLVGWCNCDFARVDLTVACGRDEALKFVSGSVGVQQPLFTLQGMD